MFKCDKEMIIAPDLRWLVRSADESEEDHRTATRLPGVREQLERERRREGGALSMVLAAPGGRS